MSSSPPRRHRPSWLRIIGGRLRGQRIRYGGQARLRPMKERVRESLFNVLGNLPNEKQVLDLFAGTGAMSFEAISRGAKLGWLIERDRQHLRMLRENISRLRLDDRLRAVAGDAFQWQRRTSLDADRPWLVFCCPPYRLYVERPEAMTRLIWSVAEQAPPHSVIVLETISDFDLASLPRPQQWDVRDYPPARLGIVELIDASTVAVEPPGEPSL